MDLAETKELRQRESKTAEVCGCLWCRNWRLVAASAMPKDISRPLQRFGFPVEQPTDLYVFSQEGCSAHYRAIYQLLGKILSGPAAVVPGPGGTATTMYRDVGTGAGLVVAKASDVWPWKGMKVGGSELLQIDLRIKAPIHVSLRAEVDSDEKESSRCHDASQETPRK